MAVVFSVSGKSMGKQASLSVVEVKRKTSFFECCWFFSGQVLQVTSGVVYMGQGELVLRPANYSIISCCRLRTCGMWPDQYMYM